jgi:hypothetical protein
LTTGKRAERKNVEKRKTIAFISVMDRPGQQKGAKMFSPTFGQGVI